MIFILPLNFSVVQENQHTVLSGVAVKLIVGLIPLLFFRIEPRRIRWDERQFLELNLVHEDPTLMLDV